MARLKGHNVSRQSHLAFFDRTPRLGLRAQQAEPGWMHRVVIFCSLALLALIVAASLIPAKW